MIDKLDVQTFLEVFKKFNGQIYGYVYLRVSKNRAVAEDLTQEIFIKAWQNRDKFNAKISSIKTWLYTIAHNRVIDHWRKAKIDTLDIEVIEHGVNGNESTVEDELMSEHVLNQLHKLDSSDQDLITWRYIQELEIEEISEIIGKNYNTTKVAIHRALQRLKQIINE